MIDLKTIGKQFSKHFSDTLNKKHQFIFG